MDKKLLAIMVALSMCSVMACDDDEDNKKDEKSCDTPMTMECVDQSTRRICGANKQWLNAPCPSNTQCSAGQCVSGGSVPTTTCTAGQRQCSGNIAQVCNAAGTWTSQACTGTTPTCKDGACIAQATGCTDGQTQCAGTTVQTCSGGQWQNGTTCSGATPYCSNGACVAQTPVVENGCPTTKGAACDSTCTPVCAADNGHAYLCGNQGTVMEWTCAGNVCSVDAATKDVNCPKTTPSVVTDEACDPNTYAKSCPDENTVLYCDKKTNKTRASTCNQCLINTETNYYCCNGENEKCGGETKCADGAKQCAGTNVQTCANATWTTTETCSGATPICSNGACVPQGQVDPNACPQTAGAACDGCTPVCTADNGKAYVCNSNTKVVMEWTCAGNVCSVSGNSVTCPKGGSNTTVTDEPCDNTYVKNCSDENSVRYCGNEGKVVIAACSQCFINTETNYYCCNGDNDRCQGTSTTCTEGAKQCQGSNVVTCVNNAWIPTQQCTDNTPICSNGTCIPQGQVDPNACPMTANAACTDCTAVCSADNSHAYFCNTKTGTIVEYTCHENVCSVGDDNRVSCPKVPSGEDCDPNTYVKNCADNNSTVKFCSAAGKVVTNQCNQCIVNTETNYYCCDGKNEKCVGTCTEGAKQCAAGNTVQTCVNGEWMTTQACSGDTPVCNQGACVSESSITYCSTQAGASCEEGCRKQCSADGSHGYFCKNGTIQEWTCANNVCSVDEKNYLTCPKPGNTEESCDPKTYQKNCSSENTVKYCNSYTNKVVEKGCNQCVVNTQTNYYCCDGNNEQCGGAQTCTEGATQCSGNNIVQTCKAGVWVDTLYCQGSTPICDNGQCTQACMDGDTRCSGDTLQSCVSGAWITLPCYGVCSNGQCIETCTNGATQCSGNTIQVCTNGTWTNTTTCTGATPICSNGACIPGGSVDDCPMVAGADCDPNNKCHAVCTADGHNAYLCNAKTGKVMKWICANDICSVDSANTVTCESESCDSSTYQKVCTDANTVKYCSSTGKVVTKTCNQCVVNTATNHFCCDGDNEECGGTQTCTNGEAKCSGNTIQVCMNGTWTNSTTCTGATPVCSNGACVPGGSGDDCPMTKDAACDKNNKCHAVCTADGGKAYFCGNNGKILEWTCANNVCSVNADQVSVTCPMSGETCDPATYQKNCSDANTVRYCSSNGNVVTKTCNQCVVNTETNYYCCNGDNEACGGSQACTNGEARCSGNTIQVCMNGTWTDSTTCTGATPVCSEGVCIPGGGADDCPMTKGATCDVNNKCHAVCTADGGKAYFCGNSGKILEWTCAGNVCSVNTDLVSVYCPKDEPVGTDCPMTKGASCDVNNKCHAVCTADGGKAYFCGNSGKILEWTCAGNVCSVNADQVSVYCPKDDPSNTCDPNTYVDSCSNGVLKYCNSENNTVVQVTCTDYAGYECLTLEGDANCYEDVTQYCSADGDLLLYQDDVACEDWTTDGVLYFSMCIQNGSKFYAPPYDYYASSICDGNNLVTCANSTTYSEESCVSCTTLIDEYDNVYGNCQK